MSVNLKALLYWILALNAFFIFILRHEIYYLPSIHSTFKMILGYNIGSFKTLAVISSLFVFIPQILAVYILYSFKKYSFEHNKSIIGSYALISWLYIISYAAMLLIVLTEFLIKLAFKRNEYLKLRQAYLYGYTNDGHQFACETLVVFLFHTSIYIFMFLTTEIIIAYSHTTVDEPFEVFNQKNQRTIAIVTAAILIYISLFVFVCDSLKIYKMSEYFLETGEILRIVTSFLINVMVAFIYKVCVSVH
jgi:hypothetical protein